MNDDEGNEVSTINSHERILHGITAMTCESPGSGVARHRALGHMPLEFANAKFWLRHWFTLESH